MRPVEQMVDAAIERIAREHEQREKDFGSKRETGHALAVASSLDDNPFAGRVPKRLRWKGLDVSEEFRSYAERIARGEDLPPFEGRVLAEPNPAFPWGGEPIANAPVEKKGRGSRIALWGSAVVVLALLGGSLALKFEANARRAAVIEPPAVGDVASSVTASSVTASSVDMTPPSAASATPTDVVETPPPDVQAAGDGIASGVAESDPATAAPATSAELVPPLHAAVVQPNSEAAVTALAAGVPVPTPATPLPAVPGRAPVAGLAAPGVASSSVAAPGAAAARPAAAPAATSASTPAGDDFGIAAGDAPSVGSATPVASPPLPSAPLPAGVAALPAPAAAPVLGNVGAFARTGQPLPGAVRKEPGSESSAKGSLLVEVPSF